MAMGTGAKIAVGCGCLLLAGTAAVVAVVGAGAFWAKGKLQDVASGIDAVTAQSEEADRYAQKANANPYSAAADGVIGEPRLLKFLDVRRQVYVVYERYRPELEDIQKKAEQSSDKLTPGQLWSAGGSLVKLAGDIRLAQMKALAEVGMSESEYRDIQMAVYKSAWASEAEASGKLPAEAVGEAIAQMSQQLPEGEGANAEAARQLQEAMKELGANAQATLEVPRANVELFRRHKAEIQKYAMSGLAFIGL
jgi:hypothetical protein